MKKSVDSVAKRNERGDGGGAGERARMVKKKRQSKRLSLKDKYKVEKKVREHHRKSRREDRKRAKAGLQPKKKKQNV